MSIILLLLIGVAGITAVFFLNREQKKIRVVATVAIIAAVVTSIEIYYGAKASGDVLINLAVGLCAAAFLVMVYLLYSVIVGGMTAKKKPCRALPKEEIEEETRTEERLEVCESVTPPEVEEEQRDALRQVREEIAQGNEKEALAFCEKLLNEGTLTEDQARQIQIIRHILKEKLGK